jgi:Glycosyl hydrolases family 38 C-terminal beta sandwich domain
MQQTGAVSCGAATFALFRGRCPVDQRPLALLPPESRRHCCVTHHPPRHWRISPTPSLPAFGYAERNSRCFFTYTLLPHAGGWEDAGTVRRAAELNQGPIALIASGRQGHLPLQDSYIQVDRDNIIVSAIKKAEDNDDIIVRCHETHKAATTATIRLPPWNRMITAHFAPCEIKTFRVPPGAALPVTETNLLEWTEEVGR